MTGRVRSALVALLLLSFTAPARAQAPNTEAELHFKRGVSLYQESDFKGALAEFKRAYELTRSWRLLYNVGQAQYQTREYAAALESFETFLKEGGDRIPKQRRGEVDGEIARLRMRVAKMTIHASVPGALVVIDDETAGQTPIVKNVAVGSRRLLVKKEGYQPWAKTIEVASGDDLVLDAALEPLAGTTPPPVGAVGAVGEDTTRRPPPPPTSHRFPIEPWIATGVLGVAFITTGIIAVSASSKLSDDKSRFDVTNDELNDDSSKVKTFATISDVLLVATIAAVGTSLYFTLKPTAPFSAQLHVSPTGGMITGRF